MGGFAYPADGGEVIDKNQVEGVSVLNEVSGSNQIVLLSRLRLKRI